MMNSTDRPKRILIAEDDPSISHLLSMQLEADGYEIILVSDGAAAWELLQQSESPDLVVLDVLMPKMNGFEVCRRIRAAPAIATLPIVILTALQDTPSRLEGLEAGANDFLGKPWNKEELYARIRTLLRLKEVQDALRIQHGRLRLLYDISQELSAYLDLDQMLSLMLTRSAQAVEAPRGSIVLLAGHRPRRKIQLNEQLKPEIITPPAMNSIEQMVASGLLKLRRPLLVADTAGNGAPRRLEAIRSLVATPFVLKEQILGFMMLLHPEPGWFDQESLEFLDSIAGQATITIENVELFERVQEERQRFAALISSMDDAVIATSKEQRIVLANPAGAQLLGRQEADLKGEPLAEKLPDGALLALFTKVAQEDRSLASEIGWDDDTTFYATVSPVGGMGQVAVIQDITELKALQAVQLAVEKEKTARVRATFERYMSPELVDRALSEERGLMEKRERRRAAVLFADIRGFTRLTARLSPDEVVTILNEFFTVMTGIAYSYHGTIFDIAGDELMVGFGVPFELSDPIGCAMQAGIEMQTVFSGLAEKWWRIYGDRRAGMGIGIDYGVVIVGNVGSPSRMNYALVGLSVNTAHALVAAASDGDVRFSEVVMDRFHTQDLKYPITPITGVQLKGRDKPETVYCMSIGRPANPATNGTRESAS